MKCEFESRTVHQVWLGNSTAECWSEKPVDTVQFRAEPPFSGSGLAGSKARALGARDREFESPLPDQSNLQGDDRDEQTDLDELC